MSGRLAAAEAGTSWQQLYVCPASKVATITLLVCNKSVNALTFSIAVMSSIGSPPSVNDEDIVYDEASLQGNSTHTTATIVLGASQGVAIKASTGAEVTVQANGFVEDE